MNRINVLLRMTALSFLLLAGSSNEAFSQKLLNKIKTGVKKEISKSINNGINKETGKGIAKETDQRTTTMENTPAPSAGDKQILSSCGLTEISLQPIGKPENGGKEHVAVGQISTKVTEQVGWRDQLPAPWKCDNTTLTTICDNISAYNKKRQQSPGNYQWNEVLAVADADYNDAELERRLEALENAAEAYKECHETFADGSATDQDKRVAARALSNALKSAYYKRTLQSDCSVLYSRMKNKTAVNILQQNAVTRKNLSSSPVIASQDEK